MTAVESLASDFFEAFRPPKKLSLSQWADEYAYLSPESSAEPGRWHTIPYQKGIMDAITDPAIERVTVKKSARVGYTKILNHAIAYHIHQDPCPIMVVQPTEIDAEGFSKEEIAPMIRDTPVLQNLVADVKAKDGSNTILQKMFPGGTLSLVGANAPRGFRRVSRRVVLFDEIDGYPASAGTEGDPIKLGERRSEYYWNRKLIAGSTPLVEETSRVERRFEQSDQRRYFVPCPQCGEFQYLKWGGPDKPYGIKWPEGEPELAYYCCEANGCVIPHAKKRWMVERGEWRATAPGDGRHAGFHIWAAYSYSPNASWGQLAAEFMVAKRDRNELKAFINLVLGETWRDEIQEKIEAAGLRKKAEAYEENVAPKGALVLTAGVDVQANRLECSVYAWGNEEEGWLVAHHVIFGDPERPEVWKQLDDVLKTPVRREGGGEMPILISAVDSSDNTHPVYAYVRDRRRLGVIAVKGQSQRGKPAIGRPTKQDINFRGQVLKWGVDLYPVGTDTIKDTLYARFLLKEHGPKYLHFPLWAPVEFFEQITVERKSLRHDRRGFAIKEWTKPDGKRNEALDCAVYAYAALQLLYTRHHRKTFWQQMEKKLGVERPPPPSADVTPHPENPPPTEERALKPKPARNMMIKRRGKGFVGGW